jgi:hypothetical protein
MRSMKTSLYTTTVPLFIKTLTTLSTLLDTAAAHAQGATPSTNELLQSKLAPDMFPFIKQVQLACDHAKAVAARLNGRQPPSLSDDDKTIEDLKAHIDKTIDILKAVKSEEVDGKEDVRGIALPYQSGTLGGFSYVFEYAIPNFYFHIVTAYAILRHKGVQIGKNDYLGSLPFEDQA